MTQWQIFTEFLRKIPIKFNIAICTNAQLSIFATAHTARPIYSNRKIESVLNQQQSYHS